MNINDLCIDHPCLKIINDNVGDKEFFPPQEEAFKTGFLNGGNLLLASPTSSGKTLVAQIAMLVNKVERHGKSVYLVPLRSLAFEKFSDFSRFYNGIAKVGLSTGDLTKSDESLSRCDIIICSYEKFDSLLRHRAPWISEVSLVVFDEVHLIDDASRGPLIEVLLTRMKLIGNKKSSKTRNSQPISQSNNSNHGTVQIVALSATIGNPEAIGDWLGASFVKSSFRPVRLVQGALNEGVVSFKNDSRSYEASSVHDLCKIINSKGKQSLVFVNNRRSAESVADSIAAELGNNLSAGNEEALGRISKAVLDALPSPTTQCRRLAACVRKGVAFNHAGLVSAQKSIVEDAFRQGLIKVISCTTVLAYGVSLPAYMVILRDLKRFGGEGLSYIPVSEYLQIAGRAGRSGFDTEGESVVMTSGNTEFELAWNNYLCAEPLSIVSKLGVEDALMSHSLALICDGSCSSIDDLCDFFGKSFFGHEYGSMEFLRERLVNVITDLIYWGLVKEIGGSILDASSSFISASDLIPSAHDNERSSSSVHIVPSKLGIRVNELYITPASAHIINTGLASLKVSPFAFVHLACSCREVKNLNLSKKDYAGLLESVALCKDNLMLKAPGPFDYEYDLFLRSVKTSLMVESWISEKGEDSILEEFNVPPGELHMLVSNLEWILYAIGELANVQGISSVKEFVSGLILRTRYGVKSELIDLISLKGIGRVRARKLYVGGLKTVSDIRNASVHSLARLIGPKTASSLKKDCEYDDK